MAERLYDVGERHPFNLEPHYSLHVSAMTTEGLHEKTDIAAELAFRDAQIDKLRRFVDAARSQLRREKFAAIQKRAKAMADISDCIETPAQLLAKLTAVERQLAERLGLQADVREQLMRLDRAGQLVEDELVRDWHDLYASYVAT